MNLFDIPMYVRDNKTEHSTGVAMELRQDEKDMLVKIEKNQFTGGAYRRATFIDKVCHSKEDRKLLQTLCEKGYVETGLGGTVAGDVYDGCWLTQKGKEALG